jgi:hypothetical protein
VPPKAIFPEPRPADLITVPCCRTCRAGTSLDDDYFVRSISAIRRTRPNAHARRIAARQEFGLARIRATGAWVDHLHRTRRVQFTTGTGLAVGLGWGRLVDRARLYRVAERIVRGLHFHALGRRVADDASVHVLHFIEFEQNLGWSRAETQARIELARGLPGGVIGGETFAWRYGEDAVGTTTGSHWWLGFYGGADFIASVGPAPASIPRPSGFFCIPIARPPQVGLVQRL